MRPQSTGCTYMHVRMFVHIPQTVLPQSRAWSVCNPAVFYHAGMHPSWGWLHGVDTYPASSSSPAWGSATGIFVLGQSQVQVQPVGCVTLMRNSVLYVTSETARNSVLHMLKKVS